MCACHVDTVIFQTITPAAAAAATEQQTYLPSYPSTFSHTCKHPILIPCLPPPLHDTHDTFELQVKYYSKISYAFSSLSHALKLVTPSRWENLLDQVLERANHALHPPPCPCHTYSLRALKKCAKSRRNPEEPFPIPSTRLDSTRLEASASNYIKKITRNSTQLQLLVELN